MRTQSSENVELGDESIHEIVEEFPCDPVTLIEMPTWKPYLLMKSLLRMRERLL